MVILQKVEECQNRNDYPYSIKRSKEDDATMVIPHQSENEAVTIFQTNREQRKITRLVQKENKKKRAR
jgi:hypothetical protein